MKAYTVNGLSASGTGPNTAGNIIGSGTIRPWINFLLYGFRTNPATTDQQVRCGLCNTTGAGTAGSAATPKPRDPAEVAAVCTAGITHSAEPTGTNTQANYFMDFDLNQRASKEWGCADGQEFVGALVASNGIASVMRGVTTAIVESCVMGWRE